MTHIQEDAFRRHPERGNPCFLVPISASSRFNIQLGLDILFQYNTPDTKLLHKVFSI